MIPVAITGVGIVSPIGVGCEDFFGALEDPASAVQASFTTESSVLTDASAEGAQTAEVHGFDAKDYLGKKGLRNFDRLTRFMIVAGKSALEDAGIKREGEFVAHGPTRVGISSATAYGSLDAITELLRVAELEAPRYINPGRFPNTVINAAAGYVSIWEDLRAPNTTVVDGNCGSLDAILNAETHLRNDRGDAFLVGGGEILSDPLFVALSKLGAVGPASNRDERVDSDFRLGEGAAYICVEEAGSAAARGAHVYAEIVGYGTAFEPPAAEAALVHGSSLAVERAIRAAIEDADVSPDTIDVVASGVSGLLELDRAELDGIEAVLGPDVPVARPKDIHGETFGASGAMALIQSLAWMRGAPVEPLHRGTAPRDIKTVLVTTVGFYGNVTAALIRATSEVE